MKLKKTIAALLAVLLLSLSGGKNFIPAVAEEPETNAAAEQPEITEEQPLGGKFNSAEERLSGMEEITSDGGLTLYCDKSYAEIAVKDAEGNIWFSSPFDYGLNTGKTSSEDVKKQLGSLIALTYYDKANKELLMNGFEDCISKNQFSVESLKNGLRINMSIGRVAAMLLVPYVMSVDVFESKILNSSLSDREKRKVSAFYTRYSSKDPAVSQTLLESMLKTYPGLAQHDFYILRPTATDWEKSSLDPIFKKTELTQGDINDSLTLSGYLHEEDNNALFELSIDVVLEGGDLVVSLPADKIEYDSENFTLGKIKLMPYFGAGKSANDGYLFVPDGSGTLIRFNTRGDKNILTTTNRVYGDDYTLTNDAEYTSLSNGVRMPVFGIRENQKAVLGIIEDGDAMAQIVSESGNIISAYETVYVNFLHTAVVTFTNKNNSKQTGAWTYVGNNRYQGTYRIRYRFLSGQKAGYVGMAQSYRDYLLKNGNLRKAKISPHTPFYLETPGALDKPATFLGFSYQKKVALTGFSDAEELIGELKKSGIPRVFLRYQGWMNGGLDYTVPSGLSIENSLGGEKGFKSLLTRVEENGGMLFPDVDFSVVRRDIFFDGYSSLFDAPKTIDQQTASFVPPGEINTMLEKGREYYAVSPLEIASYYDSFFKKYDAYKVGAVSIGSAGNVLISDYDRSGGTNRQSALEMLAGKLDGVGKSNRLMVESGNAYTFKYTSDIVNIPLTDSAHLLSDESIPFMQIVLHGSISYAAAPLNLCGDMNTAVLKSAEYGANLHFLLTRRNVNELKGTKYSRYFSIDYGLWKDRATELYRRFDEVFSGLQNQGIADHQKLSDTLFKTVYEDGTRVYVNYGTESCTAEGVIVDARSFTAAK